MSLGMPTRMPKGSPETRTRVALVRSPQKSHVANRRLLPKEVDGRSAWYRRAKELLADHYSDLGHEDNISAAERSLVRRACVMTVELERLEAKFANAGEASADDLDLYQKLTNSLRRLLESVGLKRRTRDVTPSLDQYLRSKQFNEAAE